MLGAVIVVAIVVYRRHRSKQQASNVGVGRANVNLAYQGADEFLRVEQMVQEGRIDDIEFSLRRDSVSLSGFMHDNPLRSASNSLSEHHSFDLIPEFVDSDICVSSSDGDLIVPSSYQQLSKVFVDTTNNANYSKLKFTTSNAQYESIDDEKPIKQAWPASECAKYEDPMNHFSITSPNAAQRGVPGIMSAPYEDPDSHFVVGAEMSLSAQGKNSYSTLAHVEASSNAPVSAYSHLNVQEINAITGEDGSAYSHLSNAGTSALTASSSVYYDILSHNIAHDQPEHYGFEQNSIQPDLSYEAIAPARQATSASAAGVYDNGVASESSIDGNDHRNIVTAASLQKRAVQKSHNEDLETDTFTV